MAAGENDISWDDLRLFLDVARLGGLTPATETTGVSAATLGRRVTALESQIGEPLFVRSQAGYALTKAGEELLERAQDVEAAMRALTRWRDGNAGERVVRISAGPWTSQFLASRINQIWRLEDGIRIELAAAYARVDIGRRAADIGVRSTRPTEPNLAGRRIGTVAYALYSGLPDRLRREGRLPGAGPDGLYGLQAGMFVGTTGDAANTASARWLMAHHGDRIGLRGNDMPAVRELCAAGAGLAVLPCFVGDLDPRLGRIAAPITELETEQWLVTHHEERHRPEVRRVVERIAALVKAQASLFRGERPEAWRNEASTPTG